MTKKTATTTPTADTTPADAVDTTSQTAPETAPAETAADTAADVTATVTAAALAGLGKPVQLWALALNRPGSTTAELAVAAGLDEATAREHLEGLRHATAITVQERWTIVKGADLSLASAPTATKAAPRPRHTTRNGNGNGNGAGGPSIGQTVLAILRERPAADGYSLTELCREPELAGRSSGAIGAACETLLRRGEIYLTQEGPKRYALTTPAPASPSSVPSSSPASAEA